MFHLDNTLPGGEWVFVFGSIERATQPAAQRLTA